MTLDPAFDSAVVEYTAETTDDANTVTATPTATGAGVVIKLGDTVIANGSNATWAAGENELTVTVTAETEQTVYTVTVTKS